MNATKVYHYRPFVFGSSVKSSRLLEGREWRAGAFDQQRKLCLPIYTRTKKQSCAILRKFVLGSSVKKPLLGSCGLLIGSRGLSKVYR